MRRTKTTKRRSPAKRKATGKRRNRRISGVGKMNLEQIGMKILGYGAGSVAARELNTVLVKQFPTLSTTITCMVQIAAGVFLPMFVPKSQFVADMGGGMIANGVMAEVVNLGIISGAPETMSYRINGTSRLNVIGRTNRLPRVAGAGTSNLSVIAGERPRINNGGSKVRNLY